MRIDADVRSSLRSELAVPSLAKEPPPKLFTRKNLRTGPIRRIELKERTVMAGDNFAPTMARGASLLSLANA